VEANDLRYDILIALFLAGTGSVFGLSELVAVIRATQRDGPP
jgi:hypothetical protein